MKRIVAVALSLVILALPFDAFADASWWNNTGSQEAAPTEKPPNLFSGLLGTLRGKDPDSPDDPPSIEDPDENYDDYDGDGYVNNDFWENALFGPWVGDITAKPYGGEVRYTQINDWTIAYGNCDNRFCVFGWDGNTNSYKILADTNVSGIVAAGDSFVYYGEVKKGKFGWMIRNPDQEKPVSLGLNELNSVFWSDEEYLYYFTYGKTNTYWRMDHDGKHKKQLGKISGRAIAMLENGAVLVFNSIKNRVERWKDGKDTTIYEPKEDICNVISTGREIWIVHPDYLGLLEDGEITFKISGDLRDYAMTRDQLFMQEKRFQIIPHLILFMVTGVPFHLRRPRWI